MKPIYVIVENVIAEDGDDNYEAEAIHAYYGYFTDQAEGRKNVERLNEQSLAKFLEIEGEESCDIWHESARAHAAKAFRLRMVELAAS